MKICQIIPDLPMGGAETMCVTLSIALKNMGHEVCVISLYDCDTILSRQLTDAGIVLSCMGKKPGLDPMCIPRLRKALREFRPDVIHTHIHALKYAYAAAWGLNIPMLRTIHSVAHQDAEADTKINRFLFSHGKVTPVAISEAIRETACTYYGLQEENVPVILNGVDLSRCIPKANYSYSGSFRLIHVGRFHEAKNHSCILDALAILRRSGCNVTVDFYGNGELESAIRAQAEQLELTDAVYFCGVTNNVFPHLHDADAFILPSIWEGIPMSLIEAMGTGLPIVASNVGGIPDMVENEVSGLLIPPDAQALVNSIERLMQEEAFRNRLGSHAKESAVRFAAATMAEKYCALYLHLECRKVL